MRDFQRDWIRWTRAERVSAIFIVVALMIGVPTALVNSTALGHGPAKIGRSL